MKNTRNMRFKTGAYFVWFNDLFKIISIEAESYITDPQDGNAIGMWSFHVNDEDDMKRVTKKKNPEYWL